MCCAYDFPYLRSIQLLRGMWIFIANQIAIFMNVFSRIMHFHFIYMHWMLCRIKSITWLFWWCSFRFEWIFFWFIQKAKRLKAIYCRFSGSSCWMRNQSLKSDSNEIMNEIVYSLTTQSGWIGQFVCNACLVFSRNKFFRFFLVNCNRNWCLWFNNVWCVCFVRNYNFQNKIRRIEAPIR